MEIQFDVSIDDIAPQRDLQRLGEELLAAMDEVLSSRGRRGVISFAHLSRLGAAPFEGTHMWMPRRDSNGAPVRG